MRFGGFLIEFRPAVGVRKIAIVLRELDAAPATAQRLAVIVRYNHQRQDPPDHISRWTVRAANSCRSASMSCPTSSIRTCRQKSSWQASGSLQYSDASLQRRTNNIATYLETGGMLNELSQAFQERDQILLLLCILKSIPVWPACLHSARQV